MNDTAYKISVMQAFLNGKEIEYKHSDRGTWCGCEEPDWQWEEWEYRIKPTKQLVIPWEVIKPEYKWAAMDSDDRIFFFEKEPQIERSEYWRYEPNYGDLEDGFGTLSVLNLDTGGVNWEQSLVQRPEQGK